MRSTIRAAIVAVALASVVPMSTASADTGDQHCVVHVIDKDETGQLIVSDPECYDTFTEAMTSEDVDAWGADAETQVLGVVAATFTIGTHYDGANFTGASMSVVGSDCAGGWLNVSADWNNRISSTRNGCPRIRHYSGANLTGITQDTVTPGGNLTTLNNLTSSIRYLT
ncbi:MAG TPA: peptidase inhibitor family I36 protein [Gemmatimonadales bacterium]|nr:peptidase inhibitor family I36 protein [Gemmatimonadales bacterium]